MALSPGIPTSFVPKQPVQPVSNRLSHSGSNLFLMVALGIGGVALLIALGMFAYDRYLTHQLASKEEELSAAQSRIDENTIEDFVRLRDRLSTGESLLTNHVVLSQFFDILESLTLANIRFNNMNMIVSGDHTATIDVTGTAKNFNALAAQSAAFAGEKRIKRAIFSAITLTADKLVGFRLTADLDPRLVIAGASATAGLETALPASVTPGATNAPVTLPSSAQSTSSPTTASTSPATSSAPFR